MRAIGILRSSVVAFTLCLSVLAFAGLAGCAVQTGTGDPAETEEGTTHAEPSGSGAAAATSQAVEGTAAATPDLETSPTTGGTKSGTESSAASVKAQVVSTACAGSNSCAGGSTSDNTQPLPWVAR